MGKMSKMVKKGKKANNISGAAFTAPVLTFSVMILLWASEFYVKRAQNSGENIFLELSVVQLVAFFAPTIFYYQLKHRKLSTSILISPIRISQGVFVLFASLAFFSGQILIKYLMHKYLGISLPSSASISISEDVPFIQPMLAVGLIPAICEEFFFRGVILSEYRSYGLAKAVFISALFFAFCHFSFQGFIIYFTAGLMLAFLTAVCRSVFPAMILHFANNMIDLYAGDFLNKIAETEAETYFIRFLIIVIFLFSVWRVFSRMQHIYISYAEKPPKDSHNLGKQTISGALRSPTLLFPIVAFLLITAISG